MRNKVTWLRCRRERFVCRVSELNGWRGSIRLTLNGEDCGWCSARAAFDRIAIGDLVEVSASGRYESGKFVDPGFARLLGFGI